MDTAIVPIPKVPIHIRTATMADLPFMDELQKKNGKALGYFPTRQFEDYIAERAVLMAEGKGSREQGNEGTRGRAGNGLSLDPLIPQSLDPFCPLGYIISKDRYLRRDELGVIFQLCVRADVQRSLVGAALVREVFARSAYGCRLYCLWCAKDLDANYFWEAMGFVPLAFRAGSGKKKRVHIFWQKRICEGDEETGWWYPFKTGQGAMRADRVVFPVPPGVGWRDVEAVEVPVSPLAGSRPIRSLSPLRLIARSNVATKRRGEREKGSRGGKASNGPGPGKVGILVGGRIKYVDRPGYVASVSTLLPVTPSPLLPAPPALTKRKGERAKGRTGEKIDPAFLDKNREFRDRYLEHINSGSVLLESAGKYDVSRVLPDARGNVKALPQAA